MPGFSWCEGGYVGYPWNMHNMHLMAAVSHNAHIIKSTETSHTRQMKVQVDIARYPYIRLKILNACILFATENNNKMPRTYALIE